MDSSVDIRHFVRMFWRRRAVIALCAVVVMGATYVGLDFVPKQFESSAVLMIEERQRLASELESVLGGLNAPSSGYRADEKRMDKLVSRVRSRPFLEKVVKLLKMNEDPKILEAADRVLETRSDLTRDEMSTRMVVKHLQKMISFGSAGSGIYRINVSDTDPQNAQLLAKWISELFVDVSQQNSMDELRSAHEFGAAQLLIYEQQLRESERALESFRQSMIAQTLSKSIVRADNIGRAESLYERVLDESDLTRVRVLPFARALEEAGLEGAGRRLLNSARVVNQARGLTTALEDELTTRLVSETRDGSDWPPTGTYVNLRRGLFQLIQNSAREDNPELVTDAVDNLARYVFATLDHRAHSNAGEFLGQAISDFRRQAQAEPRDEMELARLQSSVNTSRELLSSFQSQLVASDVSQAMEMTNLGLRIEILEPPELPLSPTSPNRVHILLASILMGPLLGVGIAFAAELVDPTLRSMNDFQRVFGGQILGTTPLLSKDGRPRPGFMKAYGMWTIVVLICVLVVGYRLAKPIIWGPGSGQDPVYLVDPEESQTP